MESIKPIRFVVFDNNGTALDDLHVAYGSVCEIFRTFGINPPSQTAYRREITADFMQFYWKYGIAPSITGDELNAIRKRYYQEHMHEARYRPDFKPLMRYLKADDVQRGVCSAEQHAVLVDFLVGEDLHRYFPPSLIVGSAWPKKKPFLLELARRANVDPAYCAYVGDTVDDIEAAHEAGYQAVAFAHDTGYNNERRLREAHPEFVVNSFTELQMRLNLED
jgi:phosphoglycolate phosphatase-like HAD superfamily hydrolase